MSENARDFFGALGFEETEIEDGLTALCFETDAAGSYALVTDEEGAVPESLKRGVIFACYTPEGAFEWSAGFKNAYVFRDVWAGPATAAEKVDAVSRRREEAYK